MRGRGMKLTTIMKFIDNGPDAKYGLSFPKEVLGTEEDMVFYLDNPQQCVDLQHAVEAYVRWRLIRVLDELDGEGEMWDPENWEKLELSDEAKAKLAKAWEKKV